MALGIANLMSLFGVLLGVAAPMIGAGLRTANKCLRKSLPTMYYVKTEDVYPHRLLRKVFRVLKPGGIFAGSDSLPSLLMRLIHIRDPLVPVDPDTTARNSGF
jgi:SAM-dependent methyltransferase